MSKDNITWWDLNNMKLVLGVVVSAVIAYGVLYTKVSVLETKVDNLISLNQSILEKYSGVESRYGQLSLKVNALETLHKKE